MSMEKDRSTPENRAFWDAVEKAAAEVADWPAWKRLEPAAAPTSYFETDDSPLEFDFPEGWEPTVEVRGALTVSAAEYMDLLELKDACKRYWLARKAALTDPEFHYTKSYGRTEAKAHMYEVFGRVFGDT